MYATHSEAFLAHCGDVLMGLIELLEEIFGWPKKKKRLLAEQVHAHAPPCVFYTGQVPARIQVRTSSGAKLV